MTEVRSTSFLNLAVFLLSLTQLLEQRLAALSVRKVRPVLQVLWAQQVLSAQQDLQAVQPVRRARKAKPVRLVQ